LDLRKNLLQIEKKMRRFAPTKQGFLAKSCGTLTARATLEPMHTGSKSEHGKSSRKEERRAGTRCVRQIG
jgi:hypothetical protein